MREIRTDLDGDRIEGMADRIGVSREAWRRYEAMNEPLPAQVWMRFLLRTGADPLWVLRGVGPRYRSDHSESQLDASPQEGP